jgi:hypothetical protein
MAVINIGADVSPAGLSAFDQAIMGAATPTVGSGTGGFFSDLENLGDALGGFLGGTGGQLIGAGLSIDELNKITDIAQKSAAEQARIGREAQAASAFRPFTVSTGFGGVQTTPEGGFATTLSPAQAAQQRALQGITSGLLGGFGAGIPDVQPPAGLKPPGAMRPTVTLGPKALELQARLAGQPSGGLLGGMGVPSANEYLSFYGESEFVPVGDYTPPPRETDTSGRLGNVLAQQPSQAPMMGSRYAMEQPGPSPVQRFEPISQPSNDTSPLSFRDTVTGEVVSQEQMQAITGAPSQAPTAPSTGGFGSGIPNVSGITGQALGGVSGALRGLAAPMGEREADVYERIRAVQRPEEQRRQLALQEQLQAQGRTGLRTAQFGGSPEQFALAQAQEEAKNRAALSALGQAQSEQQQQLGLAQGLFGLGSGAAALPASLQQGQLGNIGAALGLQYLPEQQLLNALSPAVNLANIAGVGQRQGAGYLTQAGISGLEDILQAETVRSQNLRDIYSSILGAQANQRAAQTAAAGTAAGNTGLLSGIGGIVDAFTGLFD